MSAYNAEITSRQSGTIPRLANSPLPEVPAEASLTLSATNWLTRTDREGIAGVNLTGVAVWSGDGPSAGSSTYKWKVTLVSPRHALAATHVAPGVGHTYAWIGSNGTEYRRQVSAVSHLGNDISVVTFSSALPAEVTPLGLPPAEWVGLDIDTPLLAASVDQNENVYCYEVTNLGNTSPQPMHPTHVLYQAATGDNAAWTKPGGPVTGDSGTPVFAIVDGLPVILCSMHMTSGGGSVLYALDEINAVINAVIPE